MSFDSNERPGRCNSDCRDLYKGFLTILPSVFFILQVFDTGLVGIFPRWVLPGSLKMSDDQALAWGWSISVMHMLFPLCVLGQFLIDKKVKSSENSLEQTLTGRTDKKKYSKCLRCAKAIISTTYWVLQRGLVPFSYAYLIKLSGKDEQDVVLIHLIRDSI